jgi:hypothetical protein
MKLNLFYISSWAGKKSKENLRATLTACQWQLSDMRVPHSALHIGKYILFQCTVRNIWGFRTLLFILGNIYSFHCTVINIWGFRTLLFILGNIYSSHCTVINIWGFRTLLFTLGNIYSSSALLEIYGGSALCSSYWEIYIVLVHC